MSGRPGSVLPGCLLVLLAVLTLLVGAIAVVDVLIRVTP